MTNFDTNSSSGYISELSLQNTQDQPDTANVSQLNIDRIVFDENNQERPPFNFGLCCSSNCRFDRSLLVILIYHLNIFMLVVFCIIFLTLCETENRFASGILALLSACLGHILQLLNNEQANQFGAPLLHVYSGTLRMRENKTGWTYNFQPGKYILTMLQKNNLLL